MGLVELEELAGSVPGINTQSTGARTSVPPSPPALPAATLPSASTGGGNLDDKLLRPSQAGVAHPAWCVPSRRL